jgi:phosphoribosylformylglycinamidine synthase
MIELECACDGGKDSLSMAAAAGGETVMAPGNLVVSAYVGCPDVTKVCWRVWCGVVWLP